MNILNQPAALSLSGNIEKFRIQSAESFSFVLSKGNTRLLSSVYTPGTDGYVTIDIRDIVESQLSFLLKDITTPYEQLDLAADFTAVIADKNITFRVLRCGVDRFSGSAETFLKANFLTWQPQVKKVTYYSPEYLTYYAVISSYVKVKAYFIDDEGKVTEEVKQLATLGEKRAYTIPVQYAVIMALFKSRLPSFYDVWVEDGSGSRLTYVQRYVAGNILSEQEQWILFENSLGGMDTFRAYGQLDFLAEHTHNIAEIDDISEEYRVDTERKFQKNTGYLDNRERQWLVDFLPSKQKYIYNQTYLRRIVVIEDNTSYTNKELPSSYTFTYRYADARPLLNLQRTDSLPDNLDIHIPDLNSFTIPPRLVEFPSQPLSEGVLFPVQQPFSEKWATTNIGAIFAYVLNKISTDYAEGGGIGHTHTNLDLLQLISYVDEYLLVNGKKIKAGYADGIAGNTFADLVTFLKGFLVGKNGNGWTVLEDGTTQAVVDRLYVKIKAVFDELEVKKKTHVGGEQIISPAGLKCVRVEELDESYRCFFLSEVDGVTINNEFTVGTLALAQEFNIKEGTSHNVSNRYYWREVTGVGSDYIDLSKTNADKDSDVPAAGDDIIGLGHLTDITRQAAIILSSVNETSPSITFYQGINTFSLAGKEVIGLGFDKSTGHAYINVYGDAYIGAKDESTYIRYSQKGGVDIKGMFHIEQGSTGWRNMEGLPDEIQAAADLAQKAQDAIDNAAVGSVNLLRNSGFTGDYESETLSSDTQLSADTELYSKQLKYWTGVATVSADSAAGSGYSAAIGSLSQSVSLIKGESYVISYKAKGTSVSVSCGSFSVSQPLTSSYQRYTHKITFNGNGIFLISGTATVCDLQLERGTIATDWKPSILDNDKSMAGFQAINYIASAIKDGSVDILGGLILANMVQLGNYKDGKMQKVTAGVSGIYNDDDDVAFWAGGTLQQAILTVMRFRNDPNYQPTDTEWANMANFVATHGGDTFLRGYIYALGGKFRGVVEALGGFFRGKVETSVDGKRIVIDPDKNTLEMYTTEGHATLILRFDTSSDGWEYGDLILRKYVGDQLIQETTVYPERIRIQNHAENTDIILTPNNVSFYGSKGETLLVGMKPVYDGVSVSKYVANIDCSNWPGKDDVSSGQVYVEYEIVEGVVTNGTLKVKR
ncbi:hypothetical protein [Phocaeicola vulgatus]|mgnify:FL=1|jgi:hypothetical protein|uniref:hypothetical protein n=1 Tax=Phocaeicola vulgatus TaxID=821 RepID=UPI001E43F885|nr:hypothetical protein [Phocaeicola vulgatus]MCG0292645.1 hypothetical protein [Phocaeicola vulgatus]